MVVSYAVAVPFIGRTANPSINADGFQPPVIFALDR